MNNEARSGNPAKRAAAKKKPSNVSEFKRRARGEVLELPSGLTVRAKRVQLQSFILQGAVPNPLMEIVQETLNKGAQADLKGMVGDLDGKDINLDQIREMYEMVDGIVQSSVQEPKIHDAPTQNDLAVWNELNPDDPKDNVDDLRDDDKLYIDEFDDEDKMFIFQWAQGGTDDVARFREEARADMATLAEIQGAGTAPVDTAGTGT